MARVTFHLSVTLGIFIHLVALEKLWRYNSL